MHAFEKACCGMPRETTMAFIRGGETLLKVAWWFCNEWPCVGGDPKADFDRLLQRYGCRDGRRLIAAVEKWL